MEWVEASGRSLGEARETALDLLGVAEDDAEFVVLSEPKAGLFGRVRGEARVQARVRPMAPPPKRGRRQRPERKRSGESGDGPGERSVGQNGSNGAREEASSGRSGPSKRKRGSGKGGSTTEEDDGTTGDREPALSGGRERGGRNGGPRSSRGGESRNGTDRSDAKPQVRKRTGASPEESEGIVEESLTIEQQGEAGREFVSGLVREFGLQADVQVREIDDETVEVAAIGDDLGLLVGPRGATLAAVQDLTRTFVQRQSENRTDRILVDVGGYREKRSAALRRFAEGIVAEVKETGTERALEPMSAADRKVVHDAVNELEGVRTRSEGEDPSRYIVIEPAS
ncbi:MAG: RNA-binding cell elongation regulator Jag/EloR [Acidimicrobiales bacterium]